MTRGRGGCDIPQRGPRVLRCRGRLAPTYSAKGAGGLTARRAARALGVSRATAGAALRMLERAGHLHGELVGGGVIGYTPTPAGRAWLAERGGRSG